MILLCSEMPDLIVHPHLWSFLDFKNLSLSSFEQLVNASGATQNGFRAHLPNTADMEQLKKEFAAFFNRALTDSWKEIKKTLLDVYLAPYIKGIEAVLKKKGMDLIMDIIQGLKTGSNKTYWDQITNSIPTAYLSIAKSIFLMRLMSRRLIRYLLKRKLWPFL